MIAIIIIILAFVVVSASLANGQHGSAALGIIIAVVLLLMGAGERRDSRAILNWLDYWAGRRERVRRTDNVRKCRRTDARHETDPVLVNGVATAGTVIPIQSTVMRCRTCGSYMREVHRIGYSSGAVYITYRCNRCKKEIPVRDSRR